MTFDSWAKFTDLGKQLHFPGTNIKIWYFLMFVKQKKRKGTLKKRHGLVREEFTNVCGNDLTFACFTGFIYEAQIRILFYQQLKLTAGKGG